MTQVNSENSSEFLFTGCVKTKGAREGGEGLSADFVTDSRTRTDFVNSSFIIQHSAFILALRRGWSLKWMAMSMTCRKRKMNGGRRLSADFVTDSRRGTDFVNSSFIIQHLSLLCWNAEVMRSPLAVVEKIKELTLQ
jgi:hypothetical protein